MKLSTQLTFITPCFCAGADQSKAEIRPASIRGELRWWFRVLGGTPEEERDVFGGVHVEPCASRVVVRVSDVDPLQNRNDLPGKALGQPLSYLGYFLHAAKSDDGRKGHRVADGAFLSPGTSFQLQITTRSPLPEELHSDLERCAQAFLHLGSLGARSTRGFGAWHVPGYDLSMAEFRDWATTLKNVNVYWCDEPEDDTRKAHMALEAFLKKFREENRISGKRPSALGSTGKIRQASAVRLRPVQLVEGVLPVVFYTPGTHNQEDVGPALDAWFAGNRARG